MTDLVVFDVDGTLVEGFTQRHFLRFMRQKGVVRTVSYLRILSWFLCHRLGLSRDPRPIMEYAFGFLHGWQEEVLNELAAQCFEQCLTMRIYRDAVRLLAGHRHAGRHVVLLSTVPEPLLRPLALRFGADVIATRLECEDGVLTGRIAGPILSGHLKLAALEDYLSGRRYERTFGYGNDASDVAFLARMNRPHAVNPDRTLAREAVRNHWPVLRFDALGAGENAN